MEIINFRNKNYDLDKLVKFISDSHVENVDNKDISTAVAHGSYHVKIAIKVDNVYHLLTGSLNPDYNDQLLNVITKHVLARSEVRVPLETESVSMALKTPFKSKPKPYSSSVKESNYKKKKF